MIVMMIMMITMIMMFMMIEAARPDDYHNYDHHDYDYDDYDKKVGDDHDIHKTNHDENHDLPIV